MSEVDPEVPQVPQGTSRFEGTGPHAAAMHRETITTLMRAISGDKTPVTEDGQQIGDF